MTAQIHQVLVGAAPGDAVTNLAFEIRGHLRQSVESEVYAFHVAPELVGEVRSLSTFPTAPDDRRLIVYHSSIGQPEVTGFLLDRSEQIALIYHNITPYELFVNVDPHFSSLLAWGRSELALLRPRVVLSVADSAFNAAELVDLGYPQPQVLPLGVRPDRLLEEPSEPDMVRLLDGVPGPIVLAVGQQLPHKRFEQIVQAVHVLETFHRRPVSLFLVGRPTLPRYHAALVAHAERLLLANVCFTGPTTEAGLATLYRRAAVYVSASTHEGIGIPALEAMSFGVPVIVRGAGAVRETVGPGAIVLDEGATPLHFAAALDALLGDPVLAHRAATLALGHAATWSPHEPLRQFEHAALALVS